MEANDSMNHDTSLDVDILKDSVNYHGPILLRRLLATRPRDWLSKLNLQQKDFTYGEYKSRQRKLTGKRKAADHATDVLNFTSDKSDNVFSCKPQLKEKVTKQVNAESHILFGHFLNADLATSKKFFYQNLKENDILIVMVDGSTNGRELPMKVICYGSKILYNLEPLNIHASLVLYDNEECWKKLTYLRVVVISYQANSRIIKVSTNQKLRPKHLSTVALGYIDWENSSIKNDLSKLEENISYSEYLSSTSCYNNPHSIKHLSSKLGVPVTTHFSLMTDLKNYEPMKAASTSNSELSEEENNEDVNPPESATDIINCFIKTERELQQQENNTGASLDKTTDSTKSTDSLSPLSQKMAQQEGYWHPPPFINTTNTFHPPPWNGNGQGNHNFNYWQQQPPPPYFKPNYNHPASNIQSNYYHQQQDDGHSLAEKMDAFLEDINKRPVAITKNQHNSESRGRDYSDERRSRSPSRSSSRRHYYEYKRSSSRSYEEYHHSRKYYEEYYHRKHYYKEHHGEPTHYVSSKSRSPYRRSRSYSRSSGSRSRSRSRSHGRRSNRYRSSSRSRRSGSESRSKRSRSRSKRSRSHSRRSKSRSKRSRSRKRSQSHSKRSRSHSRSKSRSKRHKSRSRSRSKSHSKQVPEERDKSEPDKKAKSRSKTPDSKTNQKELKEIDDLELVEPKVDTSGKADTMDVVSGLELLLSKTDDVESSSKSKHHKKKKKSHHHKKKKERTSSLDLDIPGLEDIEKKLNSYYKDLNSEIPSLSTTRHKIDLSSPAIALPTLVESEKKKKKKKKDSKRESFSSSSAFEEAIKKPVEELATEEEELVQKILAAMKK